MAQIDLPRMYGYVEMWNDQKGWGVIMDQEKQQMYKVKRDDIKRVYHNHKTLQKAEMVEFFATEEYDDYFNREMPYARHITGPQGTYLKTSTEYRVVMLDAGSFPTRWQDNYEEDYKGRFKVGEWYLKKRWNNLWHNEYKR